MSASQSHGTAAECFVIPGSGGLLPDDAFTVLIGYTVGPVMWPPLFTAHLGLPPASPSTGRVGSGPPPDRTSRWFLAMAFYRELRRFAGPSNLWPLLPGRKGALTLRLDRPESDGLAVDG